MTAAPFLMLALLVLLLPVTGALMAATPFLMPKRECFAVTVPDGAAADPVLRRLKARYALIVGAATLLATAAAVATLLANLVEATVAIVAVGLVAVSLGGYGLMLYFRQKVRAYKEAQGWVAVGTRTSALVGSEPVPQAISLRWDLLFLPLIVLCLAVCFIGYDAIPDEIPRQVNFNGEVTTYFAKSPAVAAFPALVVAFIDGCLAVSHWMIRHSRRAIDPAMPAASAWAYGMFAKAQSILLVVGGVLLGFVGLFMALSFVGVITIGQAAALTLVPVFAVALGSVALSAAYGQNGSRLIARAGATGAEADAMPRDNDRYWKLGVFYVNPNDPALFLPERFGIGWTINWGRPAAWAFVAAFALVTVAFVAGVCALT